MLVQNVVQDIKQLIPQLSARKQTPLSLKTFFEFGKNPSEKTIINSANFLREELPLRLARRTYELVSLPRQLTEMQGVVSVHDLYVDSLLKIKGHPYVNADNVDDFTNMLASIKARHSFVMQTLASGINQWKKKTSRREVYEANINSFLDSFYLGRISIRMLIGQHLGVYETYKDLLEGRDINPNVVGVIDSCCSPARLAEESASHASHICDLVYGNVPDIQIIGGKDLVFTYVPSHLRMMLFELLKNSLRAVVETHGVENDNLPPVKIIIADGDEDVTVKISDEGGGIARSALRIVWTYAYTTIESNGEEEFDEFESRRSGADRMAGFGYGLPLSRLYARYFGGDLVLMSMEGYGTDAYLHLKRLASENREVLP